MSLSPEVEIPEISEETEQLIETSRTYKIDFETGEITNEIIDGLEAIKQFVFMALSTPRYTYGIYSDDFGSEIQELLVDESVTTEFKKMEIERFVTEALIYDERIDSVENFRIEHIDDSFQISFTVNSIYGDIQVEEVL